MECGHWQLQSTLQGQLSEGLSLMVCGAMSHCNFLDPAKPLWLRQCSAKDTAAASIQQTGLSSLPPQSRTTHNTFPGILTTLCREDTSTSSRVQKTLSRVQWISNTDFYTTGINKPISHWQKLCCFDSYSEWQICIWAYLYYNGLQCYTHLAEW